MENQAPYQVERNHTYIRPVCLLSFEGWHPPSKDELRAAMDKAELPARELAAFVGVSRKEVNRWTFGAETIPFACWVLLCLRAKIGYLDLVV
jgi:hypothetical protein